MLKRIAQLTLITIILASAILIINPNSSFAATSGPSNLKIFAYPPSVLADNKTYNCIFVQLQDVTGKPARALQNTTITFSSSDTFIGTVDPTVTILNGTTFATANFTATYSPGETQITASANGYATVQTTIYTIAPFPVAIAVYGFPSTLPADGGSYEAIMVQLQDSGGEPAKAPKGGVFVTLSCSDTSVGVVSPFVVIPEGSTYAVAAFNTTIRSETGEAIVTSVAQGYESRQVTIFTNPPATSPIKLQIYAGPTQLLADQNSYRQIAIQLKDADNLAATSSSNIIVTLGSSDPTIGKIDSQIVIPAGITYVVATFNTTYRSGSTTITAVATNLLRSQQTIETYGFNPSTLAIYCIPPMLPADNGTYPTILVQLQDDYGNPAKASPSDVVLNLFSTQPTIATVPSTLTIPFGQTQTAGNVTVTNSPGLAAITAQASGYITGQSQLTTHILDFLPVTVTVTANQTSIYNAQQTEVLVLVTADNGNVTGASINFLSDHGGTFAAPTDLGNGYYNTTFTAPSFTTQTTCIITVKATKLGYITNQNTTQVTVQPPPPAPTATPTPSPTPQATTTPSPSPTPTPSPSPAPQAAIIQILISDRDGNPLSNTTVSSTTQPTGAKTLVGTTNSSGYVTFTNVSAGKYSFVILKEGFAQTNKTISYTGQPMAVSFALAGDVSAPVAGGTDWTLPIVVVVVVVLVMVISVVAVKKRRANSKQRNNLSVLKWPP